MSPALLALLETLTEAFLRQAAASFETPTVSPPVPTVYPRRGESWRLKANPAIRVAIFSAYEGQIEYAFETSPDHVNRKDVDYFVSIYERAE